MSVPIIDYASPASRKSLRLPAVSEIYTDEQPGHLTIRQVLAGRDGALGALLFAACALGVMLVMTWDVAHKWRKNMGELELLGGIMIVEASIAAVVIQNTWRKSVLAVTPHDITLRFSSPFGSTREHRFNDEQIAGVYVVDREPIPGHARVSELEIRFWAIPAVQLFAGHPPGTLADLARRILRVQPMPSTSAHATSALAMTVLAVEPSTIAGAAGRETVMIRPIC